MERVSQRVLLGVLAAYTLGFLVVRIPRTPLSDLLWLCHWLLLLTLIGFAFELDLLLTATALVSFVVQLPWVVDVFGFLLTGAFPLGVASYVLFLPPLLFLFSLHHLLLPLLLGVWSRAGLHQNGWLLAAGLVDLALLVGALSSPLRDINLAYSIFPIVQFPFNALLAGVLAFPAFWLLQRAIERSLRLFVP